jgi:hypothetical protein
LPRLALEYRLPRHENNFVLVLVIILHFDAVVLGSAHVVVLAASCVARVVAVGISDATPTVADGPDRVFLVHPFVRVTDPFWRRALERLNLPACCIAACVVPLEIGASCIKECLSVT